MICPFCRKVSPENYTICLYCGSTNINNIIHSHEYDCYRSGQSINFDETVYDIQDAALSEANQAETIQTGVQENPALTCNAAVKRTNSRKVKVSQLVSEDLQNNPAASSQDRHDIAEASERSEDSQSQTEEDLLRKSLSGRYKIIRKLGTGAMANVYLAHEISLERKVAIKVLPHEYLHDEQFFIRFRHEAKVAAMLEHPNISRIYQICEERDLCYFVMSYISCGTLTERLEKMGPLPIEDCVQWGMDICSALGYAHDHGVIHRDLKPDNIMIDGDNRAMVMDFGIARAAQSMNLTRTGTVIGTPQYMSPEQARGGKLDARSDIYSLGLVLYQMTTGSVPFKASNAISLLYMHVHKTPDPPAVRNPRVPLWLSDIIMKCLAKNPEIRFSSAHQLLQALARHNSPELPFVDFMDWEKEEKKKRTSLFITIAALIVAVAIAILSHGTSWVKNSEHMPVKETTTEINQPSKSTISESEPAIIQK